MMRAQTRRDREPPMKASMLGLAISTVAFGTGAIYLWSELAHEREQLAAVEKANVDLNARILELESRRAQFSEIRVGGPGTFEGVLAARPGPAPDPGNGTAPPPPDEGRVFSQVNMNGKPPPEMPAAMRKMIRSSMLSQNKSMYFDVQSKLGLTDQQTSALLELLTDQQAQGFRDARNLDPEQARDYWETQRARQKSELEELLGSKAADFEEYQKSMPARSELSNLTQQLASAETPLTDSQKTRMLDAFIEERDRIPMPTHPEGTSDEVVAKAYNEWQADYEKRMADQARGILTAEQLSTYNDYTQWQQEMREQFGAGMVRGPRGPLRGNAVMFAAPVAAGGVVISSSSSTVTTTEPAPKSK
jgi:hypothetical protein